MLNSVRLAIFDPNNFPIRTGNGTIQCDIFDNNFDRKSLPFISPSLAFNNGELP